ncbi:MAG: hypothetical protein CMB16_01610 [Euryarchaeota archaeon]|nr:hypothetical protein [Euryarchaeota archaeon]|tara:strand:+ start:10870 stop:11790 length:921 start_codon:yes stop_codon:yes gene_type:complete
MRIRVWLVMTLFLCSSLSYVSAGDPEKLEDVGAVFGGAHVNANESGNFSMAFSEMPAIVEDYTATWCENCVDVEHALNDVEETNNMQQYHFHRFIGESEDPLGSEEGDERWEDRYQMRLPPTVVFNGTIKQSGSVPASESLQTDYNENLANSLQIGVESSSLTYSIQANNTNPVVTWNLVIDSSTLPDNSSVKSMIWVVEKLAHFPEGSNGKEYYHDSVRMVVDLGSALSGTKEITLPDAFDGDDLEIHLIHEVVLPEPETPSIPGDGQDNVVDDDEDESSLSSIGMLPALAAIGLSALTKKKKHQ